MLSLLSSRKVVLYPELASIIGLNEAIILQEIHFWVQRNKEKNINYHDGHYWSYMAYQEWERVFPFWCKNTILRTIKSLESKGLILTGCYNLSKIDRTKWYTVNYEKLKEQFPDEAFAPNIAESRDIDRYANYIGSDLWELKRKQRLAIDRYKCVMCGTAKNLEVHHISYARLGNEDMGDLITVCRKCHEKIHEQDLASK